MRKLTAIILLSIVVLLGLLACDEGILGPATEDLPLVVVNKTDRTGRVIANGNDTGVVLETGDSREINVPVRVDDRGYESDRGAASVYLREVVSDSTESGSASDVASVTLREDKIVTLVFEEWDYARVLYNRILVGLSI